MGSQTTVPFAQAEDSGLLGPLQSPNWVKVCLLPRVEKFLGLSVGDRVLCLRRRPKHRQMDKRKEKVRPKKKTDLKTKQSKQTTSNAAHTPDKQTDRHRQRDRQKQTDRGSQCVVGYICMLAMSSVWRWSPYELRHLWLVGSMYLYFCLSICL